MLTAKTMKVVILYAPDGTEALKIEKRSVPVPQREVEPIASNTVRLT
jgi:hypothetical protein